MKKKEKHLHNDESPLLEVFPQIYSKTPYSKVTPMNQEIKIFNSLQSIQNFSEKGFLLSYSQNIFSVNEKESYFESLTENGTFPMKIAFYKDLNLIIVGFSNGKIELYSFLKEVKLIQTIKVIDSSIENFNINSNGKKMIIAPKEKKIIFFDLVESIISCSIPYEEFWKINSLDFKPNNEEIILFGGPSYILRAYSLTLWNIRSNELIKRIRVGAGALLYGFFSFDGSLIYTLIDDNTFVSINLEDESTSKILIYQFETSIAMNFIDENREKCFIIMKNNKIIVYDVKNKFQEKIKLLNSFSNQMSLIGFNFDLDLAVYKFNSLILIKGLDENTSDAFACNENDIILKVFFVENNLYFIDNEMNLSEYIPSKNPKKIFKFNLKNPEEINEISKEQPGSQLFSMTHSQSVLMTNADKQKPSLGQIEFISTNPKETLLVVVGSIKIGIWELKTRNMLKIIEKSSIIPEKTKILKISFFMNDNYIAVLTTKNIKFFSLKDFILKKELFTNQTTIIEACFYLNENKIHFALKDKVFMWEIDFSNNLIKETFKATIKLFTFENTILKISFSPKNHLCCVLFSNYERNHLFVYNMETKKLVMTFKAHKMNIKSFERMRNMPNIIFSLCSQYVILWDLEQLKEIKRIKSSISILSQVRSMEFNKTLSKLYLGLSNGSIYIIDAEKGCREKILENAHLKEITSMLLFGNEKYLCSGSLDENLKIWDLKYNESLIFEDMDITLTSKLRAHFSPDGEKLGIIDSNKKSLFIADMETKKILMSKHAKSFYTFIVWSSDSSYFVINDGNLLQIHYMDESKVSIIAEGHVRFIRCFALNLKNNQLCSAGNDSLLILWDINVVNNETLLNQTKLSSHKGVVTALTYFPKNNDLLCIATEDYLIKVLSLKKNEEIRKFEGTTNLITCINFNSTGDKMCSCGEEAHIRIWDFVTGEEELRLTGEYTNISQCIFSSDDTKIFSCGKDFSLIIWDLRTHLMEFVQKDMETVALSISYNKKYDLICSASDNLNFKKVFDRNETILQMQCIKILEIYRNDMEELCLKISKHMVYKLANNFIKPYNFSILHTLIYLEEFDDFENFINILRKKKVSFTFFEDFKGKNIIDILKEKNKIRLLDLLIIYLIEFPPSKTDCAESVNISILSVLNLKNLHANELLNSRIIKLDFNTSIYSDYINHKLTFTFHKWQPNFIELKTLAPSISREKSDNKLIINLIDFVGIIHPCSNFIPTILKNFQSDNIIFVNDVLVNVVNYKWKLYGFKIFMFNLVRCLITLTLMSINSLYFFVERDRNQENIYKVETFVFDFLLVILWLVPSIIRRNYRSLFSKNKMEYKVNFWNIMEAFCTIFLIFYIIFDLIFAWDKSYDSSKIKILHSLTLFLFWINLLSFGRAFEGIGFMLRSFIKVLKDVQYFTIILFILILAFAYSVFLMQEKFPDSFSPYTDPDYISKTRFEAFFLIYKLILGDFSDYFVLESSISYILHLIFIVATFLLMIIILNLLISILSNSFNEVKISEKIANSYEKTVLLQEIDELIPWILIHYFEKRNQIQNYLFFVQCISQSDENVNGNIDEKILRHLEKNNQLLEKITYLLEKDSKNNIDNSALIPTTFITINDKLKKVDIEFGIMCENCKKNLQKFEPQFFCYFCNLYYCNACGNLIDETKKGSYKYIHPHAMLWINISNEEGLKNLDEYKFGSKLIFDKDSDCNFRAICNGCSSKIKDCRFICINCKPGYVKDSGLFDICKKCMTILYEGDRNSEEYKKILQNMEEYEHKIDEHIYLRIVQNSESYLKF